MLLTVALQRAQVISVAELAPQLFKDPPVLYLALPADRGEKVLPQILNYGVVVEECVVDVEQKNNIVGRWRWAGIHAVSQV
jgi:hypothetical protein